MKQYQQVDFFPSVSCPLAAALAQFWNDEKQVWLGVYTADWPCAFSLFCMRISGLNGAFHSTELKSILCNARAAIPFAVLHTRYFFIHAYKVGWECTRGCFHWVSVPSIMPLCIDMILFFPLFVVFSPTLLSIVDYWVRNVRGNSLFSVHGGRVYKKCHYLEVLILRSELLRWYGSYCRN